MLDIWWWTLPAAGSFSLNFWYLICFFTIVLHLPSHRADAGIYCSPSIHHTPLHAAPLVVSKGLDVSVSNPERCRRFLSTHLEQSLSTEPPPCRLTHSALRNYTSLITCHLSPFKHHTTVWQLQGLASLFSLSSVYKYTNPIIIWGVLLSKQLWVCTVPTRCRLHSEIT